MLESDINPKELDTVISYCDKDTTIMYLEDIFTAQANLSGNPAISLPLGKHSNKLPISLHIMADSFEESKLLAFSKYLSR